MNLNFTDEEYRLLLDIVYLGQWMLDAHETAENPALRHYDMVVQKIYSAARERGLGDFIESSKELNGYFPTQKYEEESGIYDYIERYNNESFWEQLISRLAERDTEKVQGMLQDDEEPSEAYWDAVEKFSEKYSSEFSQHGLDRLAVRDN